MAGLGILLLLLRLVIYIISRSSGGSNTRDYGPVTIVPLPKPPQPDYILVAIELFAESELDREGVKRVLLELNVQEKEANEVADIAQKVNALHNTEQDTSYVPPVELLQSTDSAITYSVRRSTKPREDYAAFLRMLLGEATQQDELTKKKIAFMASYSSFLSPVRFNDSAQIFQISFGGFGGRYSAARLRTVKANDRIVSSFPYLATKSLMPLTTTEVIEWESNKRFNSEAEIIATRKDQTELSFFATDYAVNRERYLTNPELSVRISAFASEISELDPEAHLRTLTVTAPPKIPDISGTGKLSMYKFTGRVVKMKEVPISETSKAYILTLRMFENSDNRMFNVIDVFVNAENIVSGEMQQNIIVKGTFWLQGELTN